MTLEEFRSALKEILPTSKKLDDIVEALLSSIQICDVHGACPPPSESLHSWLREASRSGPDTTLLLVLGETTGDVRVPRHDRRAHDRKLTIAATSDGAAGAVAAVGLLRQLGLPPNLKFDAMIDEWSPSTLEPVQKSHLIVIGTADVNLYAAFLHSFVHEMYFGDELWPPRFHLQYSDLTVNGIPFPRRPHGSSEDRDYGVIALMKNPWKPDFRLLWVAGLTGIATHSGCRLIATGWEQYSSEARNAVGVLYEGFRDKAANPLAWLIRSEDEQKLEWVSSKEEGDLLRIGSKIRQDTLQVQKIALSEIWWINTGKQIGRGASAYVCFGEKDATGEPVAIKVLSLEQADATTPRDLENVKLLIGSKVNHVIPMFDSGMFEFRRLNTGFIVMARAEKSLQDEIAARENAGSYTPLEEEKVRTNLSQIATGLIELNKNGIVCHRDLKPRNVLYHDKKWKVTDFGLAKAKTPDHTAGTVWWLATPEYAAPEWWQAPVRLDAKSDVYSLGCIGCALVAGEPPFKREDLLRDGHPRKDPNLEHLTVSEELRRLLSQMLKVDPNQRPDSAEVIKRLDAAGDGLSQP